MRRGSHDLGVTRGQTNSGGKSAPPSAGVIFRSRLHNGPYVSGVVQPSVTTDLSVLLCTSVAFVQTRLHKQEIKGADAERPGQWFGCDCRRCPETGDDSRDQRGERPRRTVTDPAVHASTNICADDFENSQERRLTPKNVSYFVTCSVFRYVFRYNRVTL